MPINLFGNSKSNNSENRFDTSLIVQKPYLRNIYIESNLEEDIDLRNQFRIKNLPDPVSISEACNKIYVDKNFNDPTNIRNNTHVDFNDKNLENVRIIKVKCFPAIPEHLTAKNYVDQALSYSVDESSLMVLDPDEKLKIEEQDSRVLNSTLTSPMTIIELLTKSYDDSLHESRRNRRDLLRVFIDQENEFDNNKLTNFTVLQ